MLDTYNEIDIALDTWPYSGGLTTLEALWMGVPVVIQTGATFAGRHSTAHLTSVGLTDWIARDAESYVELVIAKASDPSALVETRRGLRDRMRQSPLLDHAGFTRNLERAFLRMYDFARRSGRGESIPRVIDIAESDL